MRARQSKVFAHLMLNGDSNCSEVEMALGWQKNSASRRLGEMADRGLIYRTDATRTGCFPGDRGQTVYSIYPPLW